MPLGDNILQEKDFPTHSICEIIKIQGIYFGYDDKQRNNLNFSQTLKSIKESINVWKWRGLSLLGRIQKSKLSQSQSLCSEHPLYQSLVGSLALAKGTETLKLPQKQHWHCDTDISCICFSLHQLLLLPLVLTPTNSLTTSHTYTHLFITRFCRSIGLWIPLEYYLT